MNKVSKTRLQWYIGLAEKERSNSKTDTPPQLLIPPPIHGSVTKVSLALLKTIITFSFWLQNTSQNTSRHAWIHTDACGRLWSALNGNKMHYSNLFMIPKGWFRPPKLIPPPDSDTPPRNWYRVWNLYYSYGCEIWSEKQTLNIKKLFSG